jgi:hypothetical protein
MIANLLMRYFSTQQVPGKSREFSLMRKSVTQKVSNFQDKQEDVVHVVCYSHSNRNTKKENGESQTT